MDETGTKTHRRRRGRTPHGVRANAASLQLAKDGISSSEDFRNLMCAMMADVIQGHVAPEIVNAACNAGRGLLKMVELEYRAGQPTAGAKPSLPLSRRIGSIAKA